MANASKTHVGPGSQGKEAGFGAMTDMQEDLVGENEILSNRDKSKHSDQRGLDGKAIQAEQHQDTVDNRQIKPEGADTAENTSGLSGPMSDTSGDKSSLKR